MTRVALVSDDLDFERRLRQGLGSERYAEIVGARPDLVTVDPVYAAADLGRTRPDLVVLGPRTDSVNMLAIAELLDRSHPEIVKIIVADTSPEMWELALSAGVRAVLPPDVDPLRLGDAIERSLELAARHRSNIVIDLRDPEPDTSDTGAVIDAAPSRRGRVITVLAPKGGSGKTTVATNLAAGLARLVPDGVALVDLDLQFGDVADALCIQPKHTIGDIRGRAAHLDSAELKMLLTRHESGIHALCAPEDPAAADDVSVDDVGAALQVLAADLPYVVIDTAAGIDDAALTAIERSTDLVLVASMDVPSIRNLRKLLLALDRLGMTAQTRHLVLNRARSKVGIEVIDVEATLGMPVSVAITSSRSVPISTNQGTPLILSDPKSPVARPLNELVGRFADTPAARSGGFSWRRRNR